MIQVPNEIQIYEVDRQEQSFPYPYLVITNHPTSRRLVNIQIDGKTFSISAQDLKVAIDNAINVNRY